MTTLRDTALWLHSLGANVTAIETNTKGPAHPWDRWQSERQDRRDVLSLPWQGYTCKKDSKRHKKGDRVSIGAVGIVSGVNGWRVFDLDAKKDPETKKPIVPISDATVDRLLAALGLPQDYRWVWRSGSKAGWEVEIRCDEAMPVGTLTEDKREKGVFTGWPEDKDAADWHHLELRWETCQTVVACTDGRGYQWRHGLPDAAPAVVPLHRVIQAFFELAPPPPPLLSDAERKAIKDRFDLVEYARRELGGDVQDEGREVRILGHQGLLIAPEERVWYIHGEKIGGDALDLVAFCKYRTTARNLNGKFAEVVAEAADFAGVVLPEAGAPPPRAQEPPHPAGDAQDEPPPARFTIGTEDDLMALPPLRYLDRELGIAARAFHLIYGASGSGKTFYALERALRLTAQGYHVCYVATEDVSGLRYRVAAWRRAHPEAAGRLTWLHMPSGIDLQDHQQVSDLITTITPYAFDHITIDTLREAHSGDENSSQDTARVNKAIQQIIALGASVDLVHHTGVNGERPRGSTALFGNTDVTVKVENDDGFVRVSFEKIRNGQLRDAVLFGIVQQDTGLLDAEGQPVISAVLRPASQVTTRDSRLTPTQRKVLEALNLSIFDGIGAKAQQVIDTTEITRRLVYLALAALKKRGFVSQAAKGDPYYITQAGREQLDPAPAAAACDLPDSPPESPSDRSDQQVIASDLITPHRECEVITSDHTRRVITDHSQRSHAGDTTKGQASSPGDMKESIDSYYRETGEYLQGIYDARQTVQVILDDNGQVVGFAPQRPAAQAAPPDNSGGEGSATKVSVRPWTDGPDTIAVDRGRIQELLDSGLSLDEARRQAVAEARTATQPPQGDMAASLRLRAIDPELYSAGWRATKAGVDYRLVHPDGRATGAYGDLHAAARAAAALAPPVAEEVQP